MTASASAPIRSARRSRFDQRFLEVRVTIDRESGLELSTIATGRRCVTVQVAGEMDLANADLLASLIDEQAQRGRRLIRLDLSRLTFCDCGGLRVIVQAHNQLLRARGALVLIGASASLSRLLDLAEMEDSLFVSDDVGHAHRGDSPRT